MTSRKEPLIYGIANTGAERKACMGAVYQVSAGLEPPSKWDTLKSWCAVLAFVAIYLLVGTAFLHYLRLYLRSIVQP